jgi:molybdenum cofactor guanylyltransferase
MDPRPPFTAVVLAGGKAARLGGRAKPQLEVGGRTMLAGVLSAVAAAERRIVVGPPQPVPDGVVLVRENPPGGGPVTALRTGLAEVDTEIVAVLAGDLPFLTADVVYRLRRAVAALDVALLVDDGGRDQLLCAVWRAGVLRSVLSGRRGGSVRALLAEVPPERIERVPAPVSDAPPPWFDCDTEEDLASARHWSEAEKGNP